MAGGTLDHYLTAKGFLLTPHSQAPLYQRENPETLFDQMMAEATNPTEALREVIRQTALVSLWFFEKYVAGYNGPFNKINDGLHLDMANFRQRALDPGCRFAIFTGRKFYKTTVGTTGAAAWEVVRNPDICIGLFHGVVEKAMIMLATIQQIFTGNEFFTWLFPEFHVEAPRTQARWNAHEMVVPCRKRWYPEANVMVGGATGSNQSLHFDLLDIDDLVGDEDLDSQRESGEDMIKKRNWFVSNKSALLRDKVASRVGVKATRYAVDDPYEDIMTDVGEECGYWREIDYHAKPGGTWRVYYRQAIEEVAGERVSIIPDIMPLEDLLKLQRESPWTYATWYMNNPRTSGLAEFAPHAEMVHKCMLTTHGPNEWYVVLTDGTEVALADMDVVQTGDPAGSEKRKDARTSRSSQMVVAQDWHRNFYVMSLHVGYVEITVFFDWLFGDWDKWKRLIRTTVPEAQGGFKIIEPLIRRERQLRKLDMPYRCKPKTSEKDAGIRLAVLPALKDGRIYCVEPYYDLLMEEVNGFPGSNKKDILDALRIAIEESVRPEDPEEETERHDAEDRFRHRTTNATGY